MQVSNLRYEKVLATLNMVCSDKKYKLGLFWSQKLVLKCYGGEKHSTCILIKFTVMILSFWTDRSGQTVQTQIRLLLEEKRIWYLSPMRAAKVQVSLRIRAVSPEPPLLAHTSSESRGTFRQKARSLASLNGWACAVKTCRDGMLEDTNSLDGAQILNNEINV